MSRIPRYIPTAIFTFGCCHYGHEKPYKTVEVKGDSKDKAREEAYSLLKPSSIEHICYVGVQGNPDHMATLVESGFLDRERSSDELALIVENLEKAIESVQAHVGPTFDPLWFNTDTMCGKYFSALSALTTVEHFKQQGVVLGDKTSFGVSSFLCKPNGAGKPSYMWLDALFGFNAFKLLFQDRMESPMDEDLDISAYSAWFKNLTDKGLIMRKNKFVPLNDKDLALARLSKRLEQMKEAMEKVSVPA